jgi:hypothetical protein
VESYNIPEVAGDTFELIRTVLKAIGWVVAGVAAIGIAVYLAAVVVNWRDQNPSAATVQLTALFRDRQEVADEGNGFVYVMGFVAALGDDPYQVGLKRIAWEKGSPASAAGDPLGKPLDYADTRQPAIRSFNDACKPVDTRCAAAFASGDAVFNQWVASESWLLERYRRLIGHRHWQETMPFDVAAPYPAYSLVFDGQRQLLLNARVLAVRGDYSGARARDEFVVTRLVDRLMRPLYRPQDSMNRDASYLAEMTRLVSVPLEQYKSAVQETADLAEQTRRAAFPPRSFYNVLGRMMLDAQASDFGLYARRVADLEGVRRAALLAVSLRAVKVEATEMRRAVDGSVLREPYQNRPFGLDEKEGVIVFRGLEVGERGTHRIRYQAAVAPPS